MTSSSPVKESPSSSSFINNKLHTTVATNSDTASTFRKEYVQSCFLQKIYRHDSVKIGTKNKIHELLNTTINTTGSNDASDKSKQNDTIDASGDSKKMMIKNIKKFFRSNLNNCNDLNLHEMRSIIWPIIILDHENVLMYMKNKKYRKSIASSTNTSPFKSLNDKTSPNHLLKSFSSKPFDDSGFIEMTSGVNDSPERKTSTHPDVQTPKKRLRKLPSCLTGGSKEMLRYYQLSPVGKQKVELILWSLMRNHESIITYCQLAYPLASLMLHFVDDVTTYNMLSQMLMISGHHKKSSLTTFTKGSSNHHRHVSTSKIQSLKDDYVFIKLTSLVTYSPPITSYLNPFSSNTTPQNILDQLKDIRLKLETSKEIDVIFADWIKWIFCYLPFDYVIRIFDNFLTDGIKFLFRSGLTILKLYVNQPKPSKSQQLPLISFESIMKFCSVDVQNLTTVQSFIDECYSIKNLSSVKLAKIYQKADSEFTSGTYTISETTDEKLFMSPPALSSEFLSVREIMISDRIAPFDFKSSILDYLMWDQLWEWLPDSVTVREPVILFSSDTDGISLSTFFNKCDHHSPTVILIRTTDNDTIGSFCSEDWSKRYDSSHTYFGTGETFVFSLTESQDGTVCYKWNDDHIESNTSMMFMSGDLKSGIRIGSCILFIDSSLSQGTSGPNDVTFKNSKPLTKNEFFTIQNMEVIGFN